MDVVKKILKECKEERLPSIILGSGTEFLFSKDAAAVIRMVADSGIMDVFLRTNGLLLTREMTDLILDSKITRVFISLDAASPETYRRVRGRDALGLIEKNIGYLLEERARRRSFLPIVRVSFVVLEENKREQKNFLEKWRGKVDYVDFQRFQDLTHVKEKGAQIKNEDIQVSLCSYPFYNLSILPDGNVAPCCTYYGKELVVGSIHKQTLGEIWRSKKMERIRKEILMKQFNPVCKRCLFFRETELQEEIT
jgi:radical SAM protein with 4Fe4S-binding SPASM domain